MAEENNDLTYEQIKQSIDEQLKRIEQSEMKEGFSSVPPKPVKKENLFCKILNYFKGKK